MILEFDVEIDGPIRSQPFLVRVGSWCVMLAILCLGMIVPLSLALLLLVFDGWMANQPPPKAGPFIGRFGPFIIIGPMFGLGLWMTRTVIIHEYPNICGGRAAKVRKLS